MATVTQQNNKRDWGVFWHNMGELVYLDYAIDWILKLCAILAEFLLFFGAVYAGIKLYVSMPTWADTIWVITQSIGLDIAGPGCFLLAKQAGEAGDTRRRGWAIAMGIILFVLAVTNMAVGGIVNVFHIPESKLDPTFVVSLLVIRAAVAVGYTTVSRLSKTKKEDTTFVRAAQVNEQFQQVTSMLHNLEKQNTEKMKEVESSTMKRIDALSLSLNSFIAEAKKQNETFNHRLLVKDTAVDTEALNETLTGINETLTSHAEILNILPALAAEMEGIKQQTVYQSRKVTTVVEEVRQQVEQQIKTLSAPARQQIAAPVASVKAAKKPVEAEPASASQSADFDIEHFVYECLDKNGPDMAIPAIIAAAKEINRTISTGSVSKYRAKYRAMKAQNERETPGEIAIVKVQNETGESHE